MTTTSRLNVIILIIVTVVLIAGSAAYLTLNKNNSDELDGFTALEGKTLADERANNWNVNATLINVRKADNMLLEGRCNAWYYTYYNSPNPPYFNNGTNCIEIKVYANNTLEVSSGGVGDNLPLNFWKIDSNEAYNIAQGNEEIQSFLSHDPAIYIFSLHNSTGTPRWFIEWTYDKGMDDPAWASIKIDAVTGVILDVAIQD